MGLDENEKQIHAIFAENLRRRIAEAGETQANVADALGISRSALSAYCTGEKLPRQGAMQKLANYLRVSVGELMDDGTTIDRWGQATQLARTLAYQIDELDEYGRSLVRMVVEAEARRVREARNSKQN